MLQYRGLFSSGFSSEARKKLPYAATLKTVFYAAHVNPR